MNCAECETLVDDDYLCTECRNIAEGMVYCDKCLDLYTDDGYTEKGGAVYCHRCRKKSDCERCGAEYRSGLFAGRTREQVAKLGNPRFKGLCPDCKAVAAECVGPIDPQTIPLTCPECQHVYYRTPGQLALT